MLYSAVIIIYPSVEYMKYDVWGFYEAKELKEVFFLCLHLLSSMFQFLINKRSGNKRAVSVNTFFH